MIHSRWSAPDAAPARIALAAPSNGPASLFMLIPSSQAGIVLLVALLHVLVLAHLGRPRWEPARARDTETPLVLRLIPLPAPPAPGMEAGPDWRPAQPPEQSGSAARAPRATARPSARLGGAATATPGAVSGRADMPPAVSPAVPQEDAQAGTLPPDRGASQLIGNALQAAGKIDRELRRQSPQYAAEATRQAPVQKFEKAMQAAGKKAANTTEEMTYPDGTRVVKVYGPNGVYCMYNRSVSNTAGMDVIQHGIRNTTGTCPP